MWKSHFLLSFCIPLNFVCAHAILSIQNTGLSMMMSSDSYVIVCLLLVSFSGDVHDHHQIVLYSKVPIARGVPISGGLDILD